VTTSGDLDSAAMPVDHPGEAFAGAAMSSHQTDPAQRRRLRWRARRGLLENDLVLTRFLDLYEETLTDAEVSGLHQLLELGDNELLDLILQRTESELPATDVDAASLLQRLRRV
jgi:antitoxin CptB